MAITFTKAAKPQPPKPAAQIPLTVADMEVQEQQDIVTWTPLQQQIDLVGQLQLEAEAIQKRIEEDQQRLVPLNEATKKLADMIADYEADPDQKLQIEAALHRLDAGVVGTSRSIKDLKAVKKMLGEETFMKLASVKLGDLDKYLTPPQLEQVLKTSRTKRTIKVIRKPT